MSEYNKIQISWFANGGDQIVLRADSAEELKATTEGLATHSDAILKAIGAVKQVQVAKGVFTGDNPKKSVGSGSSRVADTPPPVQAPDDDGKLYLDVPYKDKDKAKAAGAKWDKDKKQWYVTTRTDAVEQWL